MTQRQAAVVSVCIWLLLLARALQALSDLYCQSTCVCLFVRNFDAKYLGLEGRKIWRDPTPE